ncbi:hypothetical protein V8F06_012772 [Rhypophila decipiens]
MSQFMDFYSIYITYRIALMLAVAVIKDTLKSRTDVMPLQSLPENEVRSVIDVAFPLLRIADNLDVPLRDPNINFFEDKANELKVRFKPVESDSIRTSLTCAVGNVVGGHEVRGGARSVTRNR